MNPRGSIYKYILIAIAFAAITTAAILFSCEIYRILPLYVQMIQTDPKQWTFLLYTVYTLICAVLSAIYMQKLYNRQQTE